MAEFFKHKTLVDPATLTISGQLRSREKAEILPWLKSLISDSDTTVRMPVVDGTILEGSVLANQLKPGKNKSFSKYGQEVFLPFIRRYQQWSNASHVDVVLDTYQLISLKNTTNGKRACGIRRKVVLFISSSNQLEYFSPVI